ncbi:unnamed protein product [Symbiodinium sp. CCMP2592]|nr:unnamed protein product [Symbiodinium sp. CCMP2592]
MRPSHVNQHSSGLHAAIASRGPALDFAELRDARMHWAPLPHTALRPRTRNGCACRATTSSRWKSVRTCIVPLYVPLQIDAAGGGRPGPAAVEALRARPFIPVDDLTQAFEHVAQVLQSPSVHNVSGLGPEHGLVILHGRCPNCRQAQASGQPAFFAAAIAPRRDVHIAQPGASFTEAVPPPMPLAASTNSGLYLPRLLDAAGLLCPDAPHAWREGM